MDNENAAVYQEEEASITSTSPKPISTKPAKRKKTPMKKPSIKKAIKKAVKKAAKTGTRYTEEEKQKVIDFVKNNAGHGVMNKAMKEFGVSYISLRNWIKKEGIVLKKTAKSVLGKVAGKRGRPKGSVSKALGKGKDEFDSLVKVIQEKRAELKDLMGRLSKITM